MTRNPVRVLAFISEILSAKTLVPIVTALQSDPQFSVKIVNDGFCIEFIQSLGLNVEYLLEDFDLRIDLEIVNSSVILMGKSYVQPSEYQILRRAAHWGVPVLMVVPDMGIDIVRAKLKGIGDGSRGLIPYPRLLLADERTRASLNDLLIPQERITEFGNPYFDELYGELMRDRGEWNQVGVGYFSTPFELDFDRGILPADYRQADLIADIRQVCSKLSQPLLGKRHPQVDASLFEGMDVFEGTPLDMIRKVRIAVGSYSTTLLEAYAAGIPTISYQPWKENIRQDVFAGRIPIVKTAVELEEALRLTLVCAVEKRQSSFVTYNPGSSLEAALALIREVAKVVV